MIPQSEGELRDVRLQGEVSGEVSVRSERESGRHNAAMWLQVLGYDRDILEALRRVSQCNPAGSSQLPTAAGTMLLRGLQRLLCAWHPARAQGTEHLAGLAARLVAHWAVAGFV